MAATVTVTVLNLAGETVATLPVESGLSMLELKRQLSEHGKPAFMELAWEGRPLANSDTPMKLSWPECVSVSMVMRAVDLTSIAQRKDWAKAPDLPAPEMERLLLSSKEIFLKEPLVLDLSPPLAISTNFCGDMGALSHALDLLGEPGDTNHLLLGNYVNRGRHGTKILALLLSYKHQCPEHIHMLRGKNECASIARIYGFYDECKRIYTVRLFKTFAEVFSCMPMAAVIKGRIFCVASGLSPELKQLSALRERPEMRPMDVPDCGLICDLLWSDPENGITGWAEMDKGVSYIFGRDVVEKFLAENDLDFMIRGSQVVEEGHECLFNGKLISLFSTPDYVGEFNNKASVMVVDAELQHRFITFTGADVARPPRP